MLSAEDKQVFVSTLRNGLGFSKACMVINRSPKDVTEFLNSDLSFLELCRSAITRAYKALLVISNAYMNDKEFDKYKQNNEMIRAFVFRLNMWECHCKRTDVDTQKFLQASLEYVYPEEIATALGMTMSDYADYIMDNEHILYKMKQLQRYGR